MARARIKHGPQPRAVEISPNCTVRKWIARRMAPSNDGGMATEALAASNHLGFHLSFSTGRGCNLPTTYAICAVDFDHWHPRFTRSTRKNAGIGEGLAMARLTLKGAGRMNTL